MSAAPTVQSSFHEGLAAYRKVILFQALIVSSFSFWLFKEYQNNKYLQEYVQSKIPTHLSLLELVGAAVLGIAVVGLYSRSRRPRMSGGRVVEAPKLATQSPKLELERPNARPSTFPLDRSGPSSPASFLPASVIGEPFEPAVLKRVEPPPGLATDLSEPKPFPVIVRIQPPERPVMDEQPIAPQPVLKRIAPRQASSAPLSPLGSVRKVGAGLETSERPLLWKRRSDAWDADNAGSRGAPVLDKLPVPRADVRQTGSKGKARKKRRGAKRTGPTEKSQANRTA